MRILLSLILVAFVNTAFSQIPEISWQKTMGGTGDDFPSFIVAIPEGGYIVAGGTESTDGDVTGYDDDGDIWIVRLDDTGSIVWQKTIGGSRNELASSIQLAPDGGYILSGYTNSSDGDVSENKGGLDLWVVKLDDTGAITWQKTFGGSERDVAASIQPTPDGGYIVAGYTDSENGDVSFNNGNSDYWIIKLTDMGAISWEKTFGGTELDVASSIQVLSEGGYAVTGFTESTDGDVSTNKGGADIWTIKLSDTGAIIWENSLGGSSYEYGSFIRSTPDGGYVIVGMTNSDDMDVSEYHGAGDLWLTKLDKDGNLLWERAVGGAGLEEATSIQVIPDGGYVVSGTCFINDGDVSGNKGDADIWLVRFNETGDIVWQKCLGGSDFEAPGNVDITPDGGYIVTGRTYSLDGDVTGVRGIQDFWVVKLTDSVITSVADPHIFQQTSIYPNPMTNTLSIEILEEDLKGSRLSLYDITGRLVDIVHPKSKGTFTFDVHSLKPGIYILKYWNGKMMQTSKISKL